ncbi:MAG: hypothetical protein K6A76_01725 [Oribacterium sp.]|nr:hypothetical protein [Oribacterium sp.]
MKKEKELLKAIGDIDDKFVLEAMPKTEAPNVIHITNKRHVKPIGTIAAAIIIVLGFSAYITVFNGNKEALAPEAIMQDAAPAEAVSPEAQAKTGFAPEASPGNGISENALSQENAERNAVKSEGDGATSEEKKDIMTMIANPWHDSSSLSEAENDAGFDLTIPESFMDFKAEIFRSMTGKMLEIIYCDTASQEAFRIRKSNAKEQDISGDYNSYDNERTVSIDATDVTLKGTGDNVYVATWTKDGYSYAIDIDSEQSIGETEILELVKQIS